MTQTHRAARCVVDHHALNTAAQLDVIACIAFDYGGTLTAATTPIAPHLGMRPVDPAVIPALRALHRWGLRLLIASNTRPYLTRRWALREAGIEHLFTYVLNSHELGVRKPEPAFYDAVLRVANCQPDQILFVGNNVTHDVHGPLYHRMRAALVHPNRPATEKPTDGAYTITHIKDLPRLVVKLCS